MKIQFKRFDKSLPLPIHKTSGAVAVDLYSRLDMKIKPKEIVYIPMNVAIKIPDGYFVLLTPRSSTHKLGIQNISGAGIMDRDFCGDNDEYIFVAYNYTENPIHIPKGTRLCQLVLIKCENFDIEEVDEMKSVSRGGFGTTGVK